MKKLGNILLSFYWIVFYKAYVQLGSLLANIGFSRHKTSSKYNIFLISAHLSTPLKISLLSVLSILTFCGKSSGQYCIAGASNTCDEYINNFSLNTIDNTSLCTEGGYVSYISQSTSLIKGQTYTAFVTPAITGNPSIPAVYTNDEIAIWIDYNDDNDFSDFGERVGYVLSTGTFQIFEFTFTVPQTAATANVRLRLRISYSPNGDIVPCGIAVYGETEDYTINILSTIPSSPSSVSSSTSTVCPGASSTLTANGAQGTTFWFTGSCGSNTGSAIASGSSINVSPSSTTTYYARNYSNGIWSNACASTTITVSSLPSAPSNPSSNSPQCQTVTLTRTGSPSGNVNWYWQDTNPNGTSTTLGSGSTYSATSSGNYYIRARNSSGCWSSNSASTFVQVSGFPSAPPSISSSAIGCGQIALTQNNLPPQGISYYWQGTNANGTSTATSGNTYIATSSGNYYQRALNSSNCWSQSSSSINVNVNSAPSINNLYQSACNSFTWVNGVTYNSSTAAQLILDNAAENGCDSIIQLNLTVHPNYSVTDLINACDTYTWINGETYTQDNNSAVYLLPSVYGCDSLVTLNLTFGDDSDTTFIESSALDAYVLNDIAYDESGIFFQNLQNKFGCDSVIQLNIFIEPSSIENTDFSNELFRVYPNPNQTGYFQIACDSDYAIESVKNIYGQNVPAKLDVGVIDLSGFSSGFYLVTLKIAGKNYALKLIYY
jgi:hypothetical protein